LTVGSSTALLSRTLEADWRARAPVDQFGPWVFAADATHRRRLTVSVLDRRFSRLRYQAGVPGASLHRLRHNVATFLVARGQILQAQARLGHRDAATSLREHAYAVPLTDGDVADAINDHLDIWPTEKDADDPGHDHLARPR